MLLSLTEPAEVAEKAPKRVTHRGMGSYFGFVAFPVSSVCSSEAGERKKAFSLAEPAEFAETTRNRELGKTPIFYC